ncbi:MAG: FAD-dependent oxidoreductase [Ilumatobacter sp.]|uniref:FAD-dependent oxidoreductase n=1 Tax=Ilumatobacter sp. TaxID=1967498 RepID=UPI0026185D5E|nr:FAD-dependent oxidoreductase [Ilumatobacter sp.]MDJ0771535.1 FAD-dependent oxidoreductase [Ilumatobacter sp.]
MVTVVGSGVSGLTSAVALRRAGVDAHVVTDRPVDELVSWVAGAIWTIPGVTGEQPMADWALRTREVFAELAADPSTSVRPLLHRSLHRDDPGPIWWESTSWVERRRAPAGYAAELAIRGFVIEPPGYLAWLRRELESLGGTVTMRHVASLDDVRGDVVNATGLGAAQLADDRGLEPIRGQVVVVQAPDVVDGIADESDPGRISYVYPRSDEVVLGGTRQAGVADLAVDPRETERILTDALALEPRLRDAPPVDVRVGLRPGRDRPRVELEHDGERRIVHNYGHAGRGYLLSWGCAEQVRDLLVGARRA